MRQRFVHFAIVRCYEKAGGDGGINNNVKRNIQRSEASCVIQSRITLEPQLQMNLEIVCEAKHIHDSLSVNYFEFVRVYHEETAPDLIREFEELSSDEFTALDTNDTFFGSQGRQQRCLHLRIS